MFCRKFLSIGLLLLAIACATNKTNTVQTTNQIARVVKQVPTPDSIYGDLFREVQVQRVFHDGKTFVDYTPKRPVKDIMYDYGMQKGAGLNLEQFIAKNFEKPFTPQINYIQKETDVKAHIKNLWSLLKRPPDKVVEGSSLLPLPYPYIVPGGRFREIYYWDSYFTMLGLKESGETETIQHMVDNFADLIFRYGHIPNGNRSYYITRSQPPFFSLMVELLASIKGPQVLENYLPALQQEYAYWMDGAEKLQNGEAAKCVVKTANGDVLNRYWDISPTPRQESYREDLLTADTFAMKKMMTMRFASEAAMNAKRKELKAEAYHHLRAGAASGWDFSTRWFSDEQNIFNIQTTDIIPVDLNALLYSLENTLAKVFKANGNQNDAAEYTLKANRRAQLINQYCWNSSLGYYTDFNWVTGEQMTMITPAGMFPFALLPNNFLNDKIKPAAVNVEKHLLKAGGIVTTTNHSGQQWDAPNGWAPLQWMTIWGLEKMGETDLAKTIAQRWIKLNVDVYNRTGKLMEKYNVEDTKLDAGGGEYPSQDGFGWTNGVLLALMTKYGDGE